MPTNTLPIRRLVSIDEVAVATGLTRRRIGRMAQTGELPRVVLDAATHRYDLDDVLCALKAKYGEGEWYESSKMPEHPSKDR